jgi:ferredoxin
MKQKPWDLLVKPSTRQFVREGWRTAGYSFSNFLHGYVYGRWIYLYIGIGTGEHPLAKKFRPTVDRLTALYRRYFRRANDGADQDGENDGVTFADTYHGKVVPLEAATRLVTIHEEIRLPNLEQVIPYKLARDIILYNPDHIVVLECPCRSGRENPCLPLDVCLVVGEPFASFVIEHHPERARWISQAEAVEILRAENERGHVHHAFFKEAMLGRFYAICNCCACCCGAMHAHRNGTPMLASSGYVSQVDDELCLGCGLCEQYCQFGALALVDGFARVDEAICMGCGVCIDKCDQGALSLRTELVKGVPLEICSLMESAELGI